MPSFYPCWKCSHPSKPSACFFFLMCHILPWSLCVWGYVCVCLCVSMHLFSTIAQVLFLIVPSLSHAQLFEIKLQTLGIMQSFLVLHSLPESAQTHVHWVSDAIQPSQPCPLLHLTSIFPNIRVFSTKLALGIRWPKYWSLSFCPFSEYSALISFRIDWLDLVAVQGTLKSSLAPQL